MSLNIYYQYIEKIVSYSWRELEKNIIIFKFLITGV